MKKKVGQFQRANHEINVQFVRLINDQGVMMGVTPTSEALRLAKQDSLDLVEVSPNADPPVCKIMDFGKHKYQEKKKLHDAKKKQKIVSLKEIKCRPTISDHDLGIKVKSLNNFILDGDKVKVSIKFKGREITHQEIGLKVIEKIKEQLIEEAKIEFQPKMEGNQLIMIIVPK